MDYKYSLEHKKLSYYRVSLHTTIYRLILNPRIRRRSEEIATTNTQQEAMIAVPRVYGMKANKSASSGSTITL